MRQSMMNYKVSAEKVKLKFILLKSDNNVFTLCERAFFFIIKYPRVENRVTFSG